MKSPYSLEKNLIFKTSKIDDRIYLREQKGKFQQIRRSLGMILIGIFALVPFIQFNGAQAILFDLQQQQVHLFSLTLFPQDLVIVCLVFILAAFLLFYVTQFYGRVWCGFTCPQTIWMLMFNWIERRIEGTHNQSKSLDSQPMSINKFIKKCIKHFLWGSVSLFTALIFISYFVTVEQLYLPFFSLNASGITTSWVLFFTVCTYINAGWIKDKMCQHMCPYSRIQSAMFDTSTKLVSYDKVRGENRGARKRSHVKPEGMGDCVDCDLCVQVCPVGIDIRDGLQYECINCGLCVDACDSTMEKFDYQKGLISFTSEQLPQNNWKRHLGYGSMVAIILLTMFIWANTWQNFEVNIIRDRQALYRVNQLGDIENTFLFKVRNKSSLPKLYKIKIDGLEHAKITSPSKIRVLPGELNISSITVTVDEPLHKYRNELNFNITEVNGKKSIMKKTSFYSQNKGW
jgi:cytochrome c oxidase accessory protein FixG